MRVFSLEHRWNKIVSVSVGVAVDICEDYITADFAVKEVPECFCQSKEQDGEAVCQDSCVEIFLKIPGKAGYTNFEFNSKGVCYAARGQDRENREEFSRSEYAQIIRGASGIRKDGNFYRWTLSVQIPKVLLAVRADLRILQVEGNLYKCADLAAEPHWLSAFPVNTPEPDFHRPECFKVF
jgi:hypothetical protein